MCTIDRRLQSRHSLLPVSVLSLSVCLFVCLSLSHTHSLSFTHIYPFERTDKESNPTQNPKRQHVLPLPQSLPAGDGQRPDQYRLFLSRWVTARMAHAIGQAHQHLAHSSRPFDQRRCGHTNANAARCWDMTAFAGRNKKLIDWSHDSHKGRRARSLHGQATRIGMVVRKARNVIHGCAQWRPQILLAACHHPQHRRNATAR